MRQNSFAVVITQNGKLVEIADKNVILYLYQIYYKVLRRKSIIVGVGDFVCHNLSP